MKIITVAIVKGGTGKSTTAAALAQAAVKDGKRVLAVDLDPQANLTQITGADPNKAGSYHLLHGADPANLIQHTEQGIDIISANPDLSTERTTPASAMRLQTAIEPVKKKYSLVLVDTPPVMGELTYNALQASTGLLIPMETDTNALQGMYQIVEIAEQIQRTNPDLKILGTVLTRYDPRTRINRYMKDTIADEGGKIGVPLLMEIRAGIAVRESQALRLSLFDYAPRSKPAEDYRKLYGILKKT